MRIAGFTIIKNANKFSYPIAEVIEQHKDFFDMHFIGVPMEDQDDDGTRQLVEETAKRVGQEVIMVDLDWPSKDTAWTEESLDKTLQDVLIETIELGMEQGNPQFDWIVKIDADEFYDDDSIQELKEMMEIMAGSSNTCIAHNYKQYMGSLDYTVWDPTEFVCHIFQPYKAKFSGNDAMQFRPTEGEIVYLESIYLHHIGYVKDPDLITTRIREHLVLNESMYPDAVHNNEKWRDYEFRFPANVPGAKLWPIGISDQPNETEYTPVDPSTLPSVLRNKKDAFNFYQPTE